MSAKQRKLFELRLKLNEGRKKNQAAVVDEKKRVDGADLEAMTRIFGKIRAALDA